MSNHGFFIFFTMSVFALLFSVSARASVITVCPSGCNLTTIQDAINNATSWDEVRLIDTTEYNENVIVNKSVILTSNASFPTIWSDSNAATITITVGNVTISNLKIKYNGTTYFPLTAINASSVQNISILANNVSTTGLYSTAIALVATNQSIVSNNTISASGGSSNNNYGVLLWNTTQDVVQFNHLTTDGDFGNYGIYLVNAINNTIQNNEISTSGTGYDNSGIYLANVSTLNTLQSNNISTNGTYDNLGIVVFLSNNNTVDQNIISTNGSSGINVGITIYSVGNIITNNKISTNGNGNNNFGISANTNVSFIVGNNITTSGGNSNFGIDLPISSSLNILTNNIISTSGGINNHGINFYSAPNNVFKSIKISTGGNQSYGVLLAIDSNNNQFNNTNITTSGNLSHGIFFDTSKNNTFFDSIINASEFSNQIVLNGTLSGYNNYVVNSTFNTTDINVTSPDVKTKLFNAYYLDVRVTDNNGAPLSSATVSASHTTSSLDSEDPIYGSFSTTTTSSGYIPRQILSQFVVNGTYDLSLPFSLQSYFVSASKSTCCNPSSSLVTLNSSKNITITLTAISGGGGGGGGGGSTSLNWSNVPSFIEVNQSFSNTSTLTLANTGTLSTANVSINLTGVDKSWYSIVPDFITNVSGSSSNVIIINFTIPRSGTVGDYNLTINASGSVSASKNFTLRVVPFIQASNVTNETAWAAILSANTTIIQAQQKGLNVSGAEIKLSSAIQAFNAGNFTSAKQQAEDAQTEAQNIINSAPAPNLIQIPQWVYDNLQLIIVAGATLLILVVAGIAIRRRGNKSFSELRSKLDTFKRKTY